MPGTTLLIQPRGSFFPRLVQNTASFTWRVIEATRTYRTRMTYTTFDLRFLFQIHCSRSGITPTAQTRVLCFKWQEARDVTLALGTGGNTKYENTMQQLSIVVEGPFRLPISNFFWWWVGHQRRPPHTEASRIRVRERKEPSLVGDVPSV